MNGLRLTLNDEAYELVMGVACCDLDDIEILAE